MMRRIVAIVMLVAPVLAAAQGQRGVRPVLEEQVRAQLERVLRSQVGLNDGQLQKVQELTSRLEAQKVSLNQEESRVRQVLRDEVLLGDTSRNVRVAELLDRIIKITKQRNDLPEQEQKELALFMSPMQRAKYFGVQELFQRRVRELLQEQRQEQAQQKPPERP
ncbi:MAG: hypothetical protein NTZ43_04325 [Gemmatimonadetes bacterium]|nr:hypothetical protein [Gemmatimonadota bacterium]